MVIVLTLIIDANLFINRTENTFTKCVADIFSSKYYSIVKIILDDIKQIVNKCCTFNLALDFNVYWYNLH